VAVAGGRSSATRTPLFSGNAAGARCELTPLGFRFHPEQISVEDIDALMAELP
jgi:hypothetical protein